jgi:uncharacterized membrane protein (UPF0127 family)
MRRQVLVAALLSALVAPGCHEQARNPATSAASSGKDPWLDDERPLSGLPRLKLYLGARELDAELALTLEHIRKGLMWRTNIAETNGMLFVFSRPSRHEFYMKNVGMNIDVAYIDPDGVIREIHRLESQNITPVPASSDNVQFVLETAEGWFKRNGVNPGAVVRTERGSLKETFFQRR